METMAIPTIEKIQKHKKNIYAERLNDKMKVLYKKKKNKQIVIY